MGELVGCRVTEKGKRREETNWENNRLIIREREK